MFLDVISRCNNNNGESEMSHIASHRGSVRTAGLIRRLRAERASLMESRKVINSVVVVLPEDYDGDNVSADEVLAGEVKWAKLSIDGNIIGKAKVATLFATVRDNMKTANDVIADISKKLRALGVSG